MSNLLPVLQQKLLLSCEHLANQGFDTPSISPAQISQLLEYIELLQRWTKVIDLVSQQSGESMVIPHIVDSVAAFAVANPKEELCCDVGSGAGLPGIVWSVLQPDTYVQLIEPRKRRIDFLREVRRTLALENVELLSKRMEQVEESSFLGLPEGPRLIACRALGQLKEFYLFAKQHAGEGGRAIVLAGPNFQCPQELVDLDAIPDQIVEYELLAEGPSRKLVVWQF